MKVVAVEEQTFQLVCRRFSTFASQVKSICLVSSRKSEEWLSRREVCELLGISLRILQNYWDRGNLGYSQIGNKMYYKAADIERLVAAYTGNKKSNHK